MQVLVVDDLDKDLDLYVRTGMGRYPVTNAYRDDDSGAIVVVLDYEELWRVISARQINPPSSGSSSAPPDPGTP